MKFKLINIGPNKQIITGNPVTKLSQYCYGMNINNNDVVDVHESGSHDLAFGYPEVIATIGFQYFNCPVLELDSPDQINLNIHER